MDDLATPDSDRVRLRRGAQRGRYEPEVVRAILDEGVVAHVGVSTDAGPVVLPMAYGRVDDTLYLHGATANALLGHGDEQEICVTVTLVDALVIARTAFHNSMNYRCVVIRGRGRRVQDPAEHLRALRAVTDHVVENWDSGRPANDVELRRTLVVALPIIESSAKVRSGDPVDDEADLEGPHWAGTVPMSTRLGAPVPAADLRPGVPVPAAIDAWSRPEGPSS